MKAVRKDRHRAGEIPQRDLDDRDGQIEEENAVEDADDFSVAVGSQFKPEPEDPRAECEMRRWGRREALRPSPRPHEQARHAQNTRAVGIGHHRSWTLPMMYFFGTSPQ